MCPLHACCTHLTCSSFCIVHNIFKLLPTKPATADSLQQRPFLPLCSPSCFSLPQSLASKHIQPTDRHRTANIAPAPKEKHTGPLLLLTVKKLCKEHGCLPPSWEQHQFPATEIGKEPLWLPGSLTSHPDQAPRAAASLGASPPPLKPDEQVEVWRYLYHALSTQHGPEAFSLLLNSL